MTDPSAALVVALFAVGMGLAFLIADAASPTSRALSFMLGLLGFTSTLHVLKNFGVMAAGSSLWPRLASLAEAGTLVCAYEWFLRVGRTVPSSDPRARVGDRLLRASQSLAIIYGLAGIAFPRLRATFWDPELNLRLFSEPAYHLFAGPFFVSLLLTNVRVFQILRGGVDHPERIRVLALYIAGPLMIAPFFVLTSWRPLSWGPFVTALGEIIFLVGAIRYHVHQGRRSEFLARFLSPQVAQLVRERGFSSSLQQSRLQLSVVACDLRGFTAFAEAAAPEEVIQLLREYYDAIGQAVTEHGGTIKDFAGDGILTLVGAPIEYPDHGERAVVMAVGMRLRSRAFLARSKGLGLDLDLGVGVSSGFVTVGTIAGAGRLEYAAIGPAVNLASRLCDHASAGQILVDQRTVGLIGERARRYRFEKQAAVDLKGFTRPVTIYSIVGEEPSPPTAAELSLNSV